jgi:hypothetical protein
VVVMGVGWLPRGHVLCLLQSAIVPPSHCALRWPVARSAVKRERPAATSHKCRIHTSRPSWDGGTARGGPTRTMFDWSAMKI